MNRSALNYRARIRKRINARRDDNLPRDLTIGRSNEARYMEARTQLDSEPISWAYDALIMDRYGIMTRANRICNRRLLLYSSILSIWQIPNTLLLE